MGGGGIAKAVGNGGPAVAGGGVRAHGQGRDVPFALHIGEAGHVVPEVPVALQEHGAHLGEEGRLRRGFGKVCLIRAPVGFLEVDVKVHGLPGALLVKPALGFVFREDTSAGLIDEVPIAHLIVVIGHEAVFAGGVVNFSGGVR